MSSPLDEAYVVLDDFEKELAGIKAGWEQIAVDNPHLEQVSPEHWQETYYRMWLHGATNIWERNELGRWLYGNRSITETANSLAQDVHDAWRDWLETAGHQERIPSCVYDKQTREYREIESKKPGETYYASDDRFAIQAPHEGETLSTFIVRLARSVEDTGEGHRLQWRALKSFLDFIRNTYTTEQVAFIEHIFPKKMDVYYGKIIRLLLPEAFPIPEKTAAEILIEFARRCRSGRPDARHTAAEGMALCWLCIATSRIRLPKTLEMVRIFQ